MRLSTYFTIEELTASGYAARHGVNNIPGPIEMENLKHTALQLDRVRALLGCPVLISSGYRSPTVNAAIGGSKTSQHMLGQAVDFTAPNFGYPEYIARAVANSHIPFDQLILEYGQWVHISFTTTHPRGEVLTISRDGVKRGIHA